MTRLLLSLLLLATGPAALAAPAGAELATRKNCLACHAVDRKLVGPSYQDVAARYAGQKDVVSRLAEKIQKGGAGAWGPVPMPANPVTPEEAKALATWVLSHKK
ncbi:c-type cytochrome [Ideonella sp. B7]|uniref:c-type cytochrome n=1 Tax=Ideonella benzenivorans TaxID=2831643 RepID=UPI001CEC251A|nr:c-type cytochrome [Ideonella benzenivorans]MCA6217631.1 c-type cytochrome [Ideonella benzenivorans]